MSNDKIIEIKDDENDIDKSTIKFNLPGFKIIYSKLLFDLPFSIERFILFTNLYFFNFKKYIERDFGKYENINNIIIERLHKNIDLLDTANISNDFKYFYYKLDNIFYRYSKNQKELSDIEIDMDFNIYNVVASNDKNSFEDLCYLYSLFINYAKYNFKENNLNIAYYKDAGELFKSKSYEIMIRDFGVLSFNTMNNNNILYNSFSFNITINEKRIR